MSEKERRAPLVLGLVPELCAAAGIGVLLCAVADALSRETAAPPSLIYWAGLLLIAVPIFFRLASRAPGFGERLALVVLLGLSLYAVKVVRDSMLFTFPDEFVHGYNANQIAEHHHLFSSNPIIAVTARYPGLEGATSALMSIGGMSSFWAGILIVGAARLMFMAALFMLFARLSGSMLIAGLGAAAYTGTSNFLFWNAQFSYESLALPLLCFVLFAFVERDAATGGLRRAWTVPLLLAMPAVVVTHHLSSYAMVGIFVLLAVLYRLLKVPRPNPWPFAAFGLVLAGGWLLVVANSTIGYLFPVIGHAISSTVKTALGEAAPRTLFHSSTSSLGETPLAARAVALLAIALLVAGFLLGVKRTWRDYRHDPLPLIFILASLGFFAALALRFAPAAWETGNRAGEFLFIGLAFVAAHGAVRAIAPGERIGLRRVALAAGLGIVLVGGAISGWPWDVQLAQPLKATADGRQIESQPLAVARWAAAQLPDQRFAAPDADARLLLEPGGKTVFSGKSPDIQDVVGKAEFPAWQRQLLRENRLRYIVADRRAVASNNLRGYSFTVAGQGERKLLPAGVIEKFSTLPAARIYDSGDIVVFDAGNRP